MIAPRKQNPEIDSTGNGLLYLSLAHICAYLNGFDVRPEEFCNFVRNAYEKQGLLNRSRTKKDDQNGRDDYIGVCAAAKLLLLERLAWEICNAGNHRHFLFFKWFYKNDKPDTLEITKLSTWKAWLGRQPATITHIQFCAKVWPHELRIIWQAFEIWRVAKYGMGKPDSSHDAIVLHGLMALVWQRNWYQPWYMKKAITFYEKQLQLHYGSFGGVLRHVLADNHPIVTYWP